MIVVDQPDASINQPVTKHAAASDDVRIFDWDGWRVAMASYSHT
jgi:hypothetical protein